MRRVALLGAACLVGALSLSPSPGVADPQSPSPGAADPQSPGAAEPRIIEVSEQIDRLHHEAEIASESFNTVRVEMQAAAGRLRALRADVRRQLHQVKTTRAQVVGAALSNYQSGSALSTSTLFLLAGDPGAFLTGLANSAVSQDQQLALMESLTTQQQRLGVQRAQAQLKLHAVADDRQQLREHQGELDDKTQQAEELLTELKAKQRVRLLALQAAAAEASLHATSDAAPSAEVSRAQPRVSTSTAATSDRSSVAVDAALAQVGDPYVYGAAGPDSFDCSGLTMYAWAAAGVSIPHASSLQPGVGTPVSVSALSPGDLVFYYSPISHVGMYIGNGQIVHAPHPGAYVEVVPLDLMPIASAVHIG